MSIIEFSPIDGNSLKFITLYGYQLIKYREENQFEELILIEVE
jgi:hypothetical protein